MDSHVLGPLADPGLATELAEPLVDRLPQLLAREVDHGVRWRVTLVRDQFAADEHGSVRHGHRAGRRTRLPGPRCYSIRRQDGHPLSMLDHPRLAWLAALIATLAGALGARLESEEAVLRATYGYRQRKRRERFAAD